MFVVVTVCFVWKKREIHREREGKKERERGRDEIDHKKELQNNILLKR